MPNHRRAFDNQGATAADRSSLIPGQFDPERWIERRVPENDIPDTMDQLVTERISARINDDASSTDPVVEAVMHMAMQPESGTLQKVTQVANKGGARNVARISWMD